MEGTAFWVTAVLASISIGLSKGGLPVVAMMSVPILSLVISPLQAAGLLLPIYMLSDWFGVWAYRRDYNLTLLKIMIPATAIGVGIGWATASVVSERIVGGAIGVMGCAFALSRLSGWGSKPEAQPIRVLPGLFWGAASGFTSFVTHAGGPPYQIYILPLRLPKTVYAGTNTILFTWVNTVKLPAYWSIGILSFDSLPVAVWLFVPAVLAVFAGVRLVRIIPEKQFYTFILCALLLLSLRMIWVAIAA